MHAPNFIDLTGYKFGRLTVLRIGKPRFQPNGNRRTMWVCKCECGTVKEFEGKSIIKVENTFDKVESELTGQEVDHRKFKVDENTSPEVIQGFCDGANSILEPLSNNLHEMAMEEKEQELQSAKDEIARLQEQIAKLQGSNQNI